MENVKEEEGGRGGRRGGGVGYLQGDVKCKKIIISRKARGCGLNKIYCKKHLDVFSITMYVDVCVYGYVCVCLGVRACKVVRLKMDRYTALGRRRRKRGLRYIGVAVRVVGVNFDL